MRGGRSQFPIADILDRVFLLVTPLTDPRCVCRRFEEPAVSPPKPLPLPLVRPQDDIDPISQETPVPSLLGSQ